MSSLTTVTPHSHASSSTHCHSCHAGCSESKENSWGFQQVLEVVCRVALATFAMISNPITTSIGLVVGGIYGLYVGYKETNEDKEVKKGAAGGCGHGFLEELSGVRFPKVLNTLAATGITLEHISGSCGHSHEHAGHGLIPFSIFSALAGLSFGAWSGRSLWHLRHQMTCKNK